MVRTKSHEPSPTSGGDGLGVMESTTPREDMEVDTSEAEEMKLVPAIRKFEFPEELTAPPRDTYESSGQGMTEREFESGRYVPETFDCFSWWPLTRGDLAVQNLMAQIRLKDGWRRKIYDEEIVAKWRKEVEGHTGPNCIDFAVKVLKWNIEGGAKQDVPTDQAQKDPPAGHPEHLAYGIFKSDSAISGEMKAELNKLVAPLEARTPKDWHPGSDEQVLDLVHPSVYPLRLTYDTDDLTSEGFCMDLHPMSSESVKNRSQLGSGIIPPPGVTLAEWDTKGILTGDNLHQDPEDPVNFETGLTMIEEDGCIVGDESESEGSGSEGGAGMYMGETFDPSYRLSKNYTSNKFQWLPSEFLVSNEGKVTINSYINNLHPKDHPELYKVIEGVFQAMLPMFESTLGYFTSHYRTRLLVHTEEEDFESDRVKQHSERDYKFRREYDSMERLIKKAKAGEKEEGDEKEKEAEKADGEDAKPEKDGSDSDDDDEELCDSDDEMGGDIFTEQSHIRKSLRGRPVNVIVKLGEIVLTPEKPNYPGGSWHVEGMKNDSVAATGIYYFGEENIKESTLNFRKSVQQPGATEQDQALMYGISYGMPMLQDLCSVPTIEGRALCFPNTYQHQVQPFGLQDPTKPGVRKILVFFLVHPDRCCLNTRLVPPQQRDWFVRYWRPRFCSILNVPNELADIILAYIDHGIAHDIKLPTNLTPEELADYKRENSDETNEVVRFRQELMDERSTFVSGQNSRVMQRECKLCEH